MLIRIWGTFADLAPMARLFLNEQSLTGFCCKHCVMALHVIVILVLIDQLIKSMCSCVSWRKDSLTIVHAYWIGVIEWQSCRFPWHMTHLYVHAVFKYEFPWGHFSLKIVWTGKLAFKTFKLVNTGCVKDVGHLPLDHFNLFAAEIFGRFSKDEGFSHQIACTFHHKTLIL